MNSALFDHVWIPALLDLAVSPRAEILFRVPHDIVMSRFLTQVSDDYVSCFIAHGSNTASITKAYARVCTCLAPFMSVTPSQQLHHHGVAKAERKPRLRNLNGSSHKYCQIQLHPRPGSDCVQIIPNKS